MREGDLDASLVEGSFDLFGEAVAQVEPVLARRPDGELDLLCRVAEALEDHQRLRLVQAEGVSFGRRQEHLSHPAEVFFVGHADHQVEATDRKTGQRGDIRLEELLVGNADKQIVEGPELDREQVDGDDLAHGLTHFDDVSRDEGLLAQQEKAADEVGCRGLGSEAQRHGQYPRGSQEHAHVESELLDRREHDDGEHQVPDQTADHGGMRRAASSA